MHLSAIRPASYNVPAYYAPSPNFISGLPGIINRGPPGHMFQESQMNIYMSPGMPNLSFFPACHHHLVLSLQWLKKICNVTSSSIKLPQGNSKLN